MRPFISFQNMRSRSRKSEMESAYRALCLYAERKGYRVHIVSVRENTRSHYSRIVLLDVTEQEVEGVKVVGDKLDEASESLLRFLAHCEAA